MTKNFPNLKKNINPRSSKYPSMINSNRSTQCKETIERQRQRENLHSNKTMTHDTQKILNKINSWFLYKTMGVRRQKDDIFRVLKERQLTRNSIFRKTILQNEGEIKTFSPKLHTNKLDSPDEMETFLVRHELLKLTQKEIKNLSRCLRSKEIKLTPI